MLSKLTSRIPPRAFALALILAAAGYAPRGAAELDLDRVLAPVIALER